MLNQIIPIALKMKSQSLISLSFFMLVLASHYFGLCQVAINPAYLFRNYQLIFNFFANLIAVMI